MRKFQEQVLEITKDSELHYPFTNKTRGGKRENSGRKKGDPTTTISVRIPLKHANEFKLKIKELKKLYI